MSSMRDIWYMYFIEKKRRLRSVLYSVVMAMCLKGLLPFIFYAYSTDKHALCLFIYFFCLPEFKQPDCFFNIRWGHQH